MTQSVGTEMTLVDEMGRYRGVLGEHTTTMCFTEEVAWLCATED